MRCNVRIKEEQIKAIIDTGASVSVMTNKLRKELEIPVEKKSKEVLATANGEKVVVIGETMIEIEIEEWIIPMKVRIVESKDKTLIIGMNTLEELEAKIDIENSIIKGEIEGEEIEIPVEFKKEKGDEREIYEESENEIEYEEFEEFEEPDYRELMGILKEKSNQENNQS